MLQCPKDTLTNFTPKFWGRNILSHNVSLGTMFQTYFIMYNNDKQGNQRWQTSPATPTGGLGHGNVHVKFHDDQLRNGGDITY